MSYLCIVCVCGFCIHIDLSLCVCETRTYVLMLSLRSGQAREPTCITEKQKQQTKEKVANAARGLEQKPLNWDCKKPRALCKIETRLVREEQSPAIRSVPPNVVAPVSPGGIIDCGLPEICDLVCPSGLFLPRVVLPVVLAMQNEKERVC